MTRPLSIFRARTPDCSLAGGCNQENSCQNGTLTAAAFADDDDGTVTIEDVVPLSTGLSTGLCVQAAFFNCGGGTSSNFRVTYYGSIASVGQPGFETADYANILADFDTNGAGGGLGVTLTDLGVASFGGGASNDHLIEFTHSGVNLTGGQCVWIEVSGLGGDNCSFGWFDSDDEGNGIVAQDPNGHLGSAEPTLFLGDQWICLDSAIAVGSGCN